MPPRKTSPAKSTRQTGKKVSFGATPTKQARLEQWVSSSDVTPPIAVTEESAVPPVEIVQESTPTDIEKVKMKRLTLDIPELLHRSIKMQSVSLGVPMVDMLRQLLDEHYGSS